MKKNMSTADRIIRLIIAAVLVFLYFNGNIEGMLGIVALVVAVIFTFTSVVSSCPIYALLGISTCKVEKQNS